MTALDAALSYIKRGWAPVPIPPRQKGPIVDDWSKLRIKETDAGQWFNGREQNIGIILGPASGHLTDVDLDCMEAIRLAPYFLPPTDAVFGRASKPRSHWIYVADITTEKFVVGPTTLLELRGKSKDPNGGLQTVFPGSTHESGEPVEWFDNGEPARVDAQALVGAARFLAGATLLLKLMPSKGRHDMLMVVSGWLRRNGWTPEQGRHLLAPVIRVGVPDRKTDGEIERMLDTTREDLPGWPKLVDMLGTKEARALAKWLGVKQRELVDYALWTDERELKPELDETMFLAAVENDPRFKSLFLRKGMAANGTKTPESYDLSLAIMAGEMGWPDNCIAGLIMKARQGRSEWDEIQDRDHYLARTIGKAKAIVYERSTRHMSVGAAIAQAALSERVNEVMDGGSSAVCEELASKLGIPLSRVVITGLATAITYWLVLLDGRRISLGTSVDVLTLARIRPRLLSATNTVMTTLKQTEWDAVVRMLVAVAEREEAADSDPVKEIKGAIEEYEEAQSAMTPTWHSEDAAEAFRTGSPIRSNSQLGVTVRNFMRWCDGRGVMRGLKEPEIRDRLRMAGFKGMEMSRRVSGKVVRRFYWWAECNNETGLDDQFVTPPVSGLERELQ